MFNLSKNKTICINVFLFILGSKVFAEVELAKATSLIKACKSNIFYHKFYGKFNSLCLYSTEFSFNLLDFRTASNIY